MVTDLEKAFHAAMLDIYKNAKRDIHYNATRFLSMVSAEGGLASAQALIHADKVSDGYTKLWEHQRLDLSVEALILEERWTTLFTPEERAIAASRLKEYGYEPVIGPR